jgi:hypothetical protein
MKANFRFHRRREIFPGLMLNLSKSGPSLTVGVRGAHVTIGRTGIRRTVGIPGTGLYYTSHTGFHTGVHSAHQPHPVPPGLRSAAQLLWYGVLAYIIIAACIKIYFKF